MTLTALPGGVYPPIPTFFDEAGELDLATLATHVGWLMEQSLPGLLALGSNGEAMHLDDGERMAVIRAARAAIDGQRRSTPFVLLAGTADQTTRGTITRCRAAADAGADVAVVLPPFAFPTQMTATALRAHFEAVADASPIPILIYNMPANTAGIDLSADLIITLAAHPNIIGVKDSSGQVAKLARVAAETKAGFVVLAGSGSFLIPTLSVGGTGAIAAVANVLPEALAGLYDLWSGRMAAASIAETQMRERAAQMLQGHIIPINQFVTATYGVAGLKAALQATRNYGGAPRPPLLPLGAQERAQFAELYAGFEAARGVPRETGESA
jgi:4-hydroxy-2-oxoglutarate aldolase